MLARLLRTTFLLGALTVSAGALAQTSNAFGVASFSATMVMNMPTGGSLSMKMYSLEGNIRTDMPGNGGGYSLVLGRGHEMYTVIAGHCMMMPASATAKARPNPFTVNGNVQTQELGSETVDGHPTTIVQLTIHDDAGHTTTMKAWRAKDLGNFPLRVEVPTAKGTIREEFHDVSLSAPSAALFEKPTNCMTMPSFGAH